MRPGKCARRLTPAKATRSNTDPSHSAVKEGKHERRQAAQRRGARAEGLRRARSRPAAEAAHEQGWDLKEDERRQAPEGAERTYGGNDYEYGARDFGDEPVNTAGSGTADDIEKAREVLRKES